MSWKKIVSFCLFIFLSFALIGEITPLNIGVREVYAAPDMLPTDGDAWTENDNATYPWYSFTFEETLNFTIADSFVGSYSLNACHTSAWTRMRFYLDLTSQTDMSSYESVVLWIQRYGGGDKTIWIYTGDNVFYDWGVRLTVKDGSWRKVVIPFQAFQDLSGSSSWSTNRYVCFYCLTNLGVADGTGFLVDGLRFQTMDPPSPLNSLNDVWMPNNYYSVIHYAEETPVICDGNSYTSLSDKYNVTTGSQIFGNLESEAVGQSLYALTQAYRQFNSPQTLEKAELYAQWIGKMITENTNGTRGCAPDTYTNVTSTFSDNAKGNNNGWCLAGLAHLYDVTSNSTYKTYADYVFEWFMQDMWLAGSSAFAADFTISTWSNSGGATNKGKAGSVVGISAYYNYVLENATAKSRVLETFDSVLAFQANNKLDFGGTFENTAYYQSGWWEGYEAFSNQTLLNAVKNLTYLMRANDMIYGSGLQHDQTTLINATGLGAGHAGWGTAVALNVLVNLYDETSDTNTKLIFERVLFDWLPTIQHNTTTWGIEFTTNADDFSWTPTTLFVYASLTHYYKLTQAEPFIILSNAETTSTGYANNLLTFTIDGTDVTTTEVYCGDNGEPFSVVGAILWNYDSLTTIFIVNALHFSIQEIVIEWIFVESATTGIAIIALTIALCTLVFATKKHIKSSGDIEGL